MVSSSKILLSLVVAIVFLLAIFPSDSDCKISRLKVKKKIKMLQDLLPYIMLIKNKKILPVPLPLPIPMIAFKKEIDPNQILSMIQMLFSMKNMPQMNDYSKGMDYGQMGQMMGSYDMGSMAGGSGYMGGGGGGGGGGNSYSQMDDNSMYGGGGYMGGGGGGGGGNRGHNGMAGRGGGYDAAASAASKA